MSAARAAAIPRDAILDHEAVFGLGAHGARGEQEKVGLGFPSATSVAEKMLGPNSAS